MKLTEKELNRNEIYKGRILDFHVDKVELENGKVAERECVDHPGGVCIGAVNEKDEIILVRQFRYPYREVVLEAPAGKLEKGEEPFEAAKRELKEETGVTGENYKYLGYIYPSPGYTNEKLYLYSCKISSTGLQNPDEDEFIEVEKIALSKALQMVNDNQIPDAKTQIIILRTAGNL